MRRGKPPLPSNISPLGQPSEFLFQEDELFDTVPIQEEVLTKTELVESQLKQVGLKLSPRNIYHESTNPNVARFVESIQTNIKTTEASKECMKKNASKIFGMMKGTKSHYFRTLLDGEDKGHCHGIKKRMDPTTKYRLKQQMHKYQQIQEERIDEIR